MTRSYVNTDRFWILQPDGSRLGVSKQQHVRRVCCSLQLYELIFISFSSTSDVSGSTEVKSKKDHTQFWRLSLVSVDPWLYRAGKVLTLFFSILFFEYLHLRKKTATNRTSTSDLPLNNSLNRTRFIELKKTAREREISDWFVWCTCMLIKLTLTVLSSSKVTFHFFFFHVHEHSERQRERERRRSNVRVTLHRCSCNNKRDWISM